jgi:hypothetical protein
METFAFSLKGTTDTAGMHQKLQFAYAGKAK